jgi:hypothetical protein
MTEEQQFKTKALSAGMDNLNAEYRNRMDRETDSYHQAIFQLLLNVDETWRAKNEKSWFETELDKVDDGWGKARSKIVVGNIKGEVFLAPADNITDHVVQSESGEQIFFNQNAELLSKPVEQWKPEKGERYWYVTIDCGVIFSNWKNDAVDKSLFMANNCFRSEQDAIAAQERVKKALLGI